MRKQPRQKRSQEMVERLVEATARAVTARGLEFTTTNHIADAAGVNIASLYQYFSDKNDLLEAMLEKISHDTTQMVARHLQRNDIDSPDLHTVTKAGIRLGLAFLRSNELYLELLRNWQYLPVESALQHLEEYFIRVSREYFTRHFREYPIEDLHARLYVLINSVLLLIVRYLGNNTPAITEEELVNTVTDMMVLLMEHGGKRG